MSKEHDLGIVLRKLRSSNDYTQEYVARHLGITRQAYGHYENGITTPDTKMLIRLAEFFQVPITAFIELPAHSETLLCREQNGYQQNINCSLNFSDFLSFFTIPENMKKYHYLTRMEKEMIYYFQRLPTQDQKDLLLFAYVKINNHT